MKVLIRNSNLLECYKVASCSMSEDIVSDDFWYACDSVLELRGKDETNITVIMTKEMAECAIQELYYRDTLDLTEFADVTFVDVDESDVDRLNNLINPGVTGIDESCWGVISSDYVTNGMRLKQVCRDVGGFKCRDSIVGS